MTGTSRHKFIAGVQEALGRKGTSERPDYHRLKTRREIQRQKVVTIEARAQARRTELLERLAQSAFNAGWNVLRAATTEEATEYILSIAREQRARLVVRSAHEVFHRLPIDDALAKLGARLTVATAKEDSMRELLRNDIAQADMGITGVDYAIAETGTCALVPRQGVSRLVSILPPVHVAVIEAHQVYETLDDLFALRRLAFMQGQGDMGSYLSLITGPSRTADIEQTLVTGVHGPMVVHMVILETSDADSV